MSNLPLPDPMALQHSQQLVSQLKQHIHTQGGMLSFAEFMQFTLYAPGLGYYANGCEKFGAGGDFITAPELSPLFSQCLANQCQPLLQALGSEAVILELGAGSGALATGILQNLANQASLPKHYYILEPSSPLQQRQQATVARLNNPQLENKVQWLTRLPDTPLPAVIIANEVLDAMPVHRFCLSQAKLTEQVITVQDDRLTWAFVPPITPTLTSAVQALSFPANIEDYCSEINLILPAWVQSLATSITQGCLLLIDYGFPQHEFYHPARNQGTLMCHYRHRCHSDTLWYPGLQDISAHVDFTALAQAGLAAKLQLSGYTTQAMFLLNTGIADISLTDKSTIERLRLSHQIQTLTSPSEMGELFKVMALTKDIAFPLHGFALRDMRDRL